jgi:hypothetical protein
VRQCILKLYALSLYHCTITPWDPQTTVRGEVKVTEHFVAISSWPLGLAGLHIPWLSFSNFLYLGLRLHLLLSVLEDVAA